jgi:hypothetical protein
LQRSQARGRFLTGSAGSARVEIATFFASCRDRVDGRGAPWDCRSTCRHNDEPGLERSQFRSHAACPLTLQPRHAAHPRLCQAAFYGQFRGFRTAQPAE